MKPPRPIGVLLVALFDLGANTGGPRRVRQLARLFSAAGARTQVVGYRAPATAAGVICAPLAAGGIGVTLLPREAASPAHRARVFAGLPWSRAERGDLLGAIRAAAAAQPTDVLVLYNQDMIAARAIAALARELGVAFVQQYAEAHIAADFRLGPFTGRWWSERQHLRSSPRFAAGSIVISQFLRAAVATAGGGDILLLPSFVDVDEWDARLTAAAPLPPSGEPHLVYVGEGARRDAVPRIAEAVELVRRRGGTCRASFVGLKRARGPGAFPPAQPAQLAQWYRSADALILLRTDDQSSRACLPTRLGELLLSARPVVVSDLPDYNVYLRDRENAHLVRGLAPAAIADAIQAALARTPENAALGQRGRETALAHFDWRRHTAAAAAWLERVASKSNPVRSCVA